MLLLRLVNQVDGAAILNDLSLDLHVNSVEGLQFELMGFCRADIEDGSLVLFGSRLDTELVGLAFFALLLPCRQVNVLL